MELMDLTRGGSVCGLGWAETMGDQGGQYSFVLRLLRRGVGVRVGWE